MDPTVLDALFAKHTISVDAKSLAVSSEDLAHVAGTQEPVREYPDDRSKILLHLGWLTVEQLQIDLTEKKRAECVRAVQQSARDWLGSTEFEYDDSSRQQIRWLLEKTRTHESKFQIGQRIWLALVIYGLGHRGLTFNTEGQILYTGGKAGRIGSGIDDLIDLAWEQIGNQIVTVSFRKPDGTIMRGKGRQRWYAYRLTVDIAAKKLFELYAKPVDESIALIVASETFATLPQLPRSFYGGDAFQQACIDAQDGGFTHHLVLSPAHGILTLDDVVPSEVTWDEVIERRLWLWQFETAQRLGAYLAEQPAPDDLRINWWAWLNPSSIYRLTVFGSGFAARFLVDQLLNAPSFPIEIAPQILFTEQRPGYDAGDLDEAFISGMGISTHPDEQEQASAHSDLLMEDIDQILQWAQEFAGLVTVHVPPTSEVWNLAPDEAMIPARLLAQGDLPMEELLDLLTDISLLLEKPVPINMIISSTVVVSVLLQIAHHFVHEDNTSIDELLNDYHEIVLRTYVDHVRQEPNKEDRLCAVLTLAEQMQILSISLPDALTEQITIWLQTYVAAHMRQWLLEASKD